MRIIIIIAGLPVRRNVTIIIIIIITTITLDTEHTLHETFQQLPTHELHSLSLTISLYCFMLLIQLAKG